jgi:hypothetical protein
LLRIAGVSSEKEIRPVRALPKNIEMVDDEMAAVLRAMTGAQRLEIANRMFLDAQRILTLHLTAEHPDWTPEQVQREVAHRISHGLV